MVETSANPKPSRKKRILIAVVGIAMVFAVIGAAMFNVWRHSLGNVTTPVATQLNESTYRFTDGMSQTQQYLVLGSERALLIDTGNGLNDLPAAIEEITDLPVDVVNTHGHFDHIGGNHYFNDVYLPEADEELYRLHTTPEEVHAQYSDHSPGILGWLVKYEEEAITELPTKETLPLPEEGYFDLGDRKIEIVEIPGHTVGSIGLIDPQERVLFAGDMLTEGSVLMQLPESTNMSVYRDSLRTLEGLAEEGEFDEIYPGHAEPIDTSYLSKYDRLATDLLEDDVDSDVLQKGIYELEGSSLSFDPAKLQ